MKNIQFGSYLVCKEYIKEVKDFLSEFFEEEKDKYNFENWITFSVPGTTFKINLMRGEDQLVTQNMTFEVYCNTMRELKQYAKKHKKKIKNFLATKTKQKYKYHYIEIPGPENICKIEINYSEDVE